MKLSTMIHRVVFLVLFSFSFIMIHAQSWKKDIESSIEALNKATISRDQTMLDKLTEAELSYGHSTGLVEDKTAFLKNVLTGPTSFSHIENADLTISLAGDNAIVRTLSSIRGIKDGAPLDIKIGILMIWKKEGADWKLLARQGYKLP